MSHSHTDPEHSRLKFAELPPLSVNVNKTSSMASFDLSLSEFLKMSTNPTGNLNILRSKSSWFIPGLDTRSSAVQEDPDSQLIFKRKSPNEDKMFKDVDAAGFAGVWNHPMTRVYLLMFLLCKDNANLFFFRQDVTHAKSILGKTSPVKLFSAYLSKSATLPLRVPDAHGELRGMINQVKLNLETNPSLTIFDDIVYLVHKTLESIYAGAIEESSADSSPFSLKNNIEFKESVFYQMMQNDLRISLFVARDLRLLPGGKWKPTTDQYQRAVERLLNMPFIVFKNEDIWAKTEEYIASLGVELESVRHLVENVRKIRGGHYRAKSMSSIDSKRDGDTPDSAASPSKTFGDKKQDAFQAAEHAFVKYSGTGTGSYKWCEFCFEEPGEKDHAQLYRCEACGYVCHKGCRKEVRVSCTKASQSGSSDSDQDLASQEYDQKIDILEKKIESLEIEVNIESRILDGLMKMESLKTLAKDSGKSKKKPGEPDMSTQVEKSNKKIEFLKGEMARCRQQIEMLRKDQKVALQSIERLNSEDDLSGMRQAERPMSPGTVLPGENDQRFIISIYFRKEGAEFETRKAFSVRNGTFVADILKHAYKKFGIEVVAEKEPDVLTCTPPNQEETKLDPTLMLQDLNIPNLSECRFAIKPAATVKNEVKVEEEKRRRKMLEVLKEVIESEKSYMMDLQMIVELFLVPLSLSNILSEKRVEAIFSNIEAIQILHYSIVEEISKVDQESILQVVGCFSRQFDKLELYLSYCGNQHNARRCMNEVKNEPSYTREIARIEANPRLNKLSLADLLVKPMHRITRYPLLFKRLLSNVKQNSEEQREIEALIKKIEETAQKVNQVVRENESTYRISIIDENFDFGNVTEVLFFLIEKFKLANGRRELISERAFSYVKKGIQATEVTVFVFSDMVILARAKKQDTFVLFKPPIPFESAVFLDKADVPGMKNTFQIIHLQQEIHTLQTRSKLDKANWLQEAEDQRQLFCTLYSSYEYKFLQERAKMSKYESMSDGDEDRDIPTPPSMQLKRRTTTSSAIDEQGGPNNVSFTNALFRRTGAGTIHAREGSNNSISPKRSILKKGRGDESNMSLSIADDAANSNSAQGSSTIVRSQDDIQKNSSLIRSETKNRRMSRSFDMLAMDEISYETGNEKSRSQSQNPKSDKKTSSSVKKNLKGAMSVTTLSSWLKKRNASGIEVADSEDNSPLGSTKTTLAKKPSKSTQQQQQNEADQTSSQQESDATPL